MIQNPECGSPSPNLFLFILGLGSTPPRSFMKIRSWLLTHIHAYSFINKVDRRNLDVNVSTFQYCRWQTDGQIPAGHVTSCCGGGKIYDQFTAASWNFGQTALGVQISRSTRLYLPWGQIPRGMADSPWNPKTVQHLNSLSQKSAELRCLWPLSSVEIQPCW